MENKFKVKRYDLYWIEKQKFEIQELKRVIEENKLTDQLKLFPKVQMDFHEDAINWFKVRDIEVDYSEDIKKPKTDKAKAESEFKKSSKKSIKDISIGIDED
jgi:hypothetical protein